MKFHLVNKDNSMRYLFLFLFAFIGLGAVGQDIPERPNPPRLVNDFAGVLSSGQKQAIEEDLVNFYNQTSTQITVVVTPDLGGTSIDDFSFKLGEKWGVGHKGRNNGIVMVIKPKSKEAKGEAFVATGYGLEGAVPDVVARRIVDHDMIPHFRSNDYSAGIGAGIATLKQLTQGEFTAEGYLKRTNSNAEEVGGGIGIIIILVIVFLISKVGSTRKASIGHDLPFWVALSMLGSVGRSNRGHWDGFSGGSGGLGGGGFSGFGGGSFGGGGSGGSW